MIIKLRNELRGNHIHMDVFTSSNDNQTFTLCGKLVLNIAEWQSISAALLLGADRMNGNLTIKAPNDSEIIEKLEKEIRKWESQTIVDI